ncbi:thioesterase II family protein [Yinghuangia sp. YIM S09857]|uniref:thioesterase II family protein n=1 Tax=Yinghuangia sp. YIM S09857 TaxID=3436929 RepID=UPI003F52EC17
MTRPADHGKRWLRCWTPRPTARLRLVCLPHAGGGAGSYRAWDALMPGGVELVAAQYPGREDRFGDPPVDGMDDLVRNIADAVTALGDRPYALFGHSMGSAVAWELAHELRRRGAREPVRLCVSGREAPVAARAGTVHLRDDDGLCDELERLGGTHRDVLADADLRRAVLSYVRDDYRLIETYRPRPRAPLGCPIDVFTGDADPEFGADRAEPWAALTTAGMRVHVFPGGHFYLTPHRREVVATLAGRLDPTATVTNSRWPSTP